MSEKLPSDPRAFAPAGDKAAKRVNWRTVIIFGGGLSAIVATVWITSPSEKARDTSYRLAPRATTAEYDPPKVIPAATSPLPPLHNTGAQSQMQQRSEPQQELPRMERPVAPPEPKLVSVSSSVGAQLPEYLKPKQPPQPPEPTGIVYKKPVLDGAKAFTIADQSLVLPPQPIQCVMDTLIVTGSSGEAPFQCHLEHDVLSPTSVVLMEAGTQVLGYYKSVVGQGQKRVVAVTAHARTPYGVVVPLGGPVADQLGAAGVEGSVDNHWGEKFGGALLLSLIDNAVSLGQSALSKEGSTSVNVSGGGIGSLAQQMLANNINIPPTITVPQGTRVQLWTTKFIDFSDSYRLEKQR